MTNSCELATKTSGGGGTAMTAAFQLMLNSCRTIDT